MSIPYRLRKAGILLALILIICLALALGLRKTVTLNIDGQSQSVTTYAFTVGSLLHIMDISVSPLDEHSRAHDTWLKNGDQITLVHAIPVQILADGQIRSLYSPDRIPSNLLTAVGMNVLPGDHVLSNGQVIDPTQPFPADTKSLSLQIIPLVNYSLTVDNSIKDLTSTAPSLGSDLWAAGSSFFAAYHLIPPANTPLTPGLSATLNPSHQVIINVQDGYLTTRTAATTAGEAL